MPNEPIKGLNTPNTGDLVGAWGTTAVNANMQAIGGMLGGVVTLSLSGATTFALTVPTGSITPGGGPTQSQNALIKCTGALSGDNLIQVSLPGFYIVDNQTTGSFDVQLRPLIGTGNAIGLPHGKKSHVFFDGTHMDFVNPLDPGTAVDLHGATALPRWMSFCSMQPYLIKDGTSYSTASFPALAAQLNNAFGGAGGSFNVPDERARMRLALDTGGTGRVTAGGSGVDATTMGATGGSELAQSHTHNNTLNDPGHSHTGAFNSGGSNHASATPPGDSGFNQPTSTNTTGITITNAAANSGNSQNMPPTIVSFLALIKT